MVRHRLRMMAMLHNRHHFVFLGLLLSLFLSGCQQDTESGVPDINLAPSELEWIGTQVFRNECAGRDACLVHWNHGEAFPSLGIGHFIWYPADVDEPFVESFPAMIEYLTEQGVVLPDWLSSLTPFDAPWSSRESMMHAANAERVAELRDFLSVARGQQAAFMVQRAEKAFDRVINAAPREDKPLISQKLNAMASTPGGVYALIDYVNFKGEGLAMTERYQGQGWGLLQVLQGMNEVHGTSALQAFRESAARALTRRAENAPRAIEKERWLPGWLNRLETYHEPD